MLELMITNGLTFQLIKIQSSDCEHPYEISDMILSKDNSKLIAYYSLESNSKNFYVREFHYSGKNYNYKMVKKISNTSNLTIKEDGVLLEIQITFVDFQLNKSNLRQNISIKKSKRKLTILMPKGIIPE